MKIPKIYSFFKEGQVFTIDEVRYKLGINDNALRKRLSDLTTRGHLLPIRQGLYRLAKSGEPRFKRTANSPYEIASKITPHCYIGYKTALQLHANEHIHENEKVYIISQKKFNSFHFDLRTYVWCQSSENYGLETKLWCHENSEFSIKTTNLEKTLIDCLKRPIYCPNFDELMKLCQKIKNSPDIEKLIFYAKKIDIRSVYNRLGYLLESNQDHWCVSNFILRKLENKMNQKQISWSIIKKGGAIRRWKINNISYKKTPQKILNDIYFQM